MPQLILWAGRGLLAYTGVSVMGYAAGNQIGKSVGKVMPYALGAGAVYLALRAKK